MLRMKKVLKGIIRGLDHIVNFIALSLILAAMFLSGYMLWDSHQVYQTADAKNYEAYIPTEKNTKSFEELQKIIPLADRVVIKTVEVEETTKGGLILTGSAKEKPQVAQVVAVGPGGVVDGKEVKMTVKVGDKVLTSKYSGTEVKVDGEECTIVRQADILAIVE